MDTFAPPSDEAIALFQLAVANSRNAPARAFFADLAAVINALKIEAYFAEHGRQVVLLYGAQRQLLNKLLRTCDAWFCTSTQVMLRDAVGLIQAREPTDEATLAEVLPFTYGYLLVDMLTVSIRHLSVLSLEMLLDSPTFVKYLVDDERRFVLAVAMSCLARHGTRDKINVLVAHGGRVDGDDIVATATPLEASTEQQKNHSLLVLVENGATTVGLTGLLPCAVKASPRSTHDHVSELIRLGVDVNACQDDALHVAAREKNPYAVHNLIANGFADVEARDTLGQTPLLWAVAQNDEVNFSRVWKMENATVIKQLIVYGADPNARDNLGRTALLLAPLTHHHRLVEVLLTHGADPTIADREGRTPLHRVGESPTSMSQLTTMLLKKGASVHAMMTDGRTPLHTLLAGFAGLHTSHLIKSIKLLREHGADPTLPDNEGITPLDICFQSGWTSEHEIVQALMVAVKPSDPKSPQEP